MNMLAVRFDRGVANSGLATACAWLAIGVLGFSATTPARGQCDPQQQAKLTASDAAPNDWFGSVAIDGYTVVIGARQDDNATGVDAGAAYVYTRSGPPGFEIWTQQAKLIGDEPIFGLETSNQSGIAVDVSGNTALVGSWLWPNGNATGLVYVFVRSGPPGGEVWTQQTVLICPQFGSYQYFGASLALEGDAAVVGTLAAPGLDVGGQAFFYSRSGPPGGESWSAQQVYPSDGVPGDQFGVSVAMSPSQNTAVVGAWLDDNAGGTDAGSAYVYVRTGNTWVEQAKLTASDGAAEDQFGRQVAIDGDTIVVGARQDDHAGGANAGSAYVFTRSGSLWTQQAKLTASDAAAGDEFGLVLTIAGDRLIVGAYSDDHAGGADAGSAYVFTRAGATWTERSKITAPDAAAGDAFGGSLALSGDMALISSVFDDHAGGIDAGAAYVFDLNCVGAPCPGDVNGDAAVDLSDLSILLSHFGTTSGAALADGDLDGDEDVNLSDLTLLLSNFGAIC